MRVFDQDDADELISLIWDNQAHLAPWMPWVHDYDPASTAEFTKCAAKQVREGQGAQFVVIRSQRLSGTIGFTPSD